MTRTQTNTVIDPSGMHQLVKARVQQVSPVCYYIASFGRDGHKAFACMLWTLCRAEIAIFGQFQQHCADGGIAIAQG